VPLQSLFQTSNSPRDKFLSRLFGIFNEEIVRCWCRADQSPYRDMGRPTVRRATATRGYTLDFAFESKTESRRYIGELKCELEYKGYRYLTLESPDQLNHHTKEAFRVFLDAAKHPNKFVATIKSKRIEMSGSILVWGRCADLGRAKVKEHFGLHEVLSLETIIADLVAWKHQDFTKLLDKYQMWTNELFSGLRRIERADQT